MLSLDPGSWPCPLWSSFRAAHESGYAEQIPLSVSDIFISYAKEDKERASALATTLSALGRVNAEHLAILEKGAELWDECRAQHCEERVDLS